MRNDGGFFIPDDVVNSIPEISLPALHLYCLLGRARTLAGYPRIEDLASEIGKPQATIWKLLGSLYERKFLNDADMEQLMLSNEGEQ